MIFDLIAQQSADSGTEWTPDALFNINGGDRGFWFDGSDYSTMFQDAGGTIPVTGVGQVVGLWKTNLISFNISAINTSTKPVTVSTSGKLGVSFDGVDDMLSMSSGVSVDTSRGVTFALGQRKTANTNHSALMIASTTVERTFINNQVTGAAISVLNQQVVPGGAASTTQANIYMGWGAPAPYSVLPVGRLNTNEVTGDTLPTRTSVTVQATIPGVETNRCIVSQAFFINRVLTPAEITLLETFIASKQ